MTRLQVNVTEEQLKDIDSLMKKCGIETKKEFFNNAFVLLDWAVGEQEKGNLIASINKSTERYSELQMPVLNYVYKRREDAPKERQMNLAAS